MTTIPDSIKAQLDADWTGAGGAEPTYYVKEDYRGIPPKGEDAVYILSDTLKSPRERVNDTYATVRNTIDVVVNTATSEDRLKELADEVERILSATAIAGVNLQHISDRRGVSNKTFNYQEIMTVHMTELLRSAASAHGAGTTGDFAVVGDLTVGGDSTLTGDLIGRGTTKLGDTDDYFQFAAVTNIPTLTIIGNSYYIIKSDDGTYVRQLLGEDTSNFIERRWHKGSNLGEIYSTHALNLYSGGTLALSMSASQEAQFNGNMSFTASKNITVGSAYFLPRRIRQSAEPTPQAGEMLIWSDSDDDKVYLVYNDANAGVVKNELT